MRGGRNKFGSYYKRDRAQRMQRIALRANGTHNFFNQSTTEQQVSSSTPTGIAATAAATAAAAVHAQYFDTSGNQKFKNDYDALLQSPTLSSSTQPPTNYVVPRPSAYLPNCDNLAALLGSSIDDPLLRSSSFPIYSCVKPEPFDGYTEAKFSKYSLVIFLYRHFGKAQVDDQIALIYTSWAPIHVLDFTFHILHSHLPISIQFGNSPLKSKLPVSTICLMGFDTLAPKFNELCSKLQSLNFDRCDYAAFKVLTLFEDRGLLLAFLSTIKQSHSFANNDFSLCERSAVNNCALTSQVHSSILSAWAAYRSVPTATDHPLYVVYEELNFRLLARQAAHLLSKYSTVGMEENLLKEMLTRKEHHLVSQQPPPTSIPPPPQQYA
uniref:NR LBD domain-containing protein n=1 Tax=Elaeophora elaphi TaxID=1147741 RepID=A0A0R3S598_9BILA